MPSNSLLKDLQANNSQLNRLVTNKLKVNSLSLNDINNSNVSPDDILLGLITLNIQDANLYADRIEFKVENFKLTEWEQRPVGNAKVKYNKHYNYKNDEALNVLKNLWNDDFQGKYSASLSNPNANLTILIPEELFTDRYIIIKNYDVNDDLVTLYIESQEGSPEIKPMKNVPLKIVIDNFFMYAWGAISAPIITFGLLAGGPALVATPAVVLAAGGALAGVYAFVRNIHTPRRRR